MSTDQERNKMLGPDVRARGDEGMFTQNLDVLADQATRELDRENYRGIDHRGDTLFENDRSQYRSPINRNWRERAGTRNRGHFEVRKPVVMPELYDGRNPFSDYLAHFEIIGRINDWSENEKGTYLAASLRGTAQQILGDPSQSLQFEDLKRALFRRFDSVGQSELCRAQLKAITKQPQESYPELAHKITRLIARAYPDAPHHLRDTLAKDHFIDAVVDPDMRYRIQVAKPRSLDDAVMEAVQLDALHEAEKQRIGHYHRRPTRQTEIISPENDVLMRKIDALTQELNQLKAEKNTVTNPPKFPQNNKRKCWNCGSEDHFRSKCPRPLRPQPNQMHSSFNANQSGYLQNKFPGQNSNLNH